MTLPSNLTTTSGTKFVLTETEATLPFRQESRGRYLSDWAAVVLPKTTEEVSEIVNLCANYSTSVVPQGGNS